MNGLFLTLANYSATSGVGKKIQAQIKGLKSFGLDNIFYGRTDNINHLIVESRDLGPLISVSNFFGRINHFNKLVELIYKHDIKFIYYRFNGFSDPETVILFRKLKKMGIKQVMEIPTYPYDGELESKNRFYYLDKLTRKYLAHQFDYIVTFSDNDTIFGKETIKISNGIDFDEIPARVPVYHEDINLIAVANVNHWHGYDRIIEGIGLYYKKNRISEVRLHIVGPENDCVNSLKALSKNLGIEKYVLFHGECVGKKLDELFNIADFAIGSLGRHRNNIRDLKTLKNVEYAARGIPFIYSENNADFDNKAYILKAPADDTPINIDSIISFIFNKKFSIKDIRESVADMSWKIQMCKVIDKYVQS